MKKCPYCGAQMNDDSLFCAECGKPFPQSNVCPHCGASMNEGDTFCQNCGKKLNELPSNVTDSTLRKCHFCGAEINDGDAFCQSCGQVLRPSFPDLIEHKANFNSGLNSIGGKIIITPTQLIFRAHAINFGNLNDRIYEIKDITGYKKGVLTFLYISFSNGKDIKLTVWNKDEIINQLEERRRALICNSEIVNPTQCNVCPHCGASMNDGDAFCGNCGKKTEDVVLPVVSSSSLRACPHCGEPMSEEDVFCQNCGKRPDETITYQSVSYTEVGSTVNWKKVLTIILCIILLAGCSIAGYYIYSDYAEKKEKKEAQIREEKEKAEAIHRRDSLDQDLWQKTLEKDNEEAYRHYLKQFPEGKHADQAQKRVEREEMLKLTDSEKESVLNTINSFFSNLANEYEEDMLSYLNPSLSLFLGKKNATKVDAIAYMKKIHSGDVISVKIVMGDIDVSKALDGEHTPVYTALFYYDQRLEREDTSQETFASLKGKATINSNFKITSLSLSKTASY